MTLQECYVKIGGDYNDILHRFMNENMIHKFVLKFPQDNNMALFEESWAKKDYETAFRAMHTLKGVAVNLGFTALYNVSSALTEKLRSQEYDNLDGLITDVKKQYDIVIEAIAADKQEETASPQPLPVMFLYSFFFSISGFDA